MPGDLTVIKTEAEAKETASAISISRTPKGHTLKTEQVWFHEIQLGRKNFEMRFNDRDFQVRDFLTLREWTERLGYSGRQIIVKVLLVLKDYPGIEPGFCVMSLGDRELIRVKTCRYCGCTEEDCSACIQRTGQPCHWIAEDRCSACADAEAKL